jgi:hypothetical protein
MDHCKKIALIFGAMLAFSNASYGDQLSQQAEQKAAEEVAAEMELNMKEFPLNGVHKQMIADGFTRNTSGTEGIRTITMVRQTTDEGLISNILVQVPYSRSTSKERVMASITIEVEVTFVLAKDSDEVEITYVAGNNKTIRIEKFLH